MTNITDERKKGLLNFCQDWDKAMVQNNASEIGRFMADDWVIIGTEGGITSKENFLAFIRSGDLLHDRMDFEDLRVEIYGDTGVVTSRGTSGGSYRKQPFSFYEWSTNMFIYRDDNWLCVLTMLTPAIKDSAPPSQTI
jgi:ketosteroid isomerase-like protein